ncbi:Vitamin B12 import ATP-binding protein BtuD [Streptomyces fumanus]
MPEPILEVRGLVKHYPLTRGILLRKQIGAVKAVDGVDFHLDRGETLGIVGESGCGKSTVAKMLVNLERPTAGEIRYKGEDITRLSGKALKAVRRNIQMVFQDPYTSLNPRMTVGDIIGEAYDIHPEAAPKGDRRRRVRELLDVVGLNPEYLNRYPHQFSGGQRQRIGIARGLALRPEIIVADEPVSALDVSVQAQVINLLDRLQKEFDLSYVFIAHDLSIVRHISDRVGVMYLGRIVETGTDTEIYRPPHPPLHPGAALRRPRPRPRGPRGPGADHPRRGRALADQHPLRVPVPHPLLEGAGALRPGGAGAGGARGLPGRGRARGARLGLSLRRGEAGRAGRGVRRTRRRAGVTWRTPARLRHPHGRTLRTACRVRYLGRQVLLGTAQQGARVGRHALRAVRQVQHQQRVRPVGAGGGTQEHDTGTVGRHGERTRRAEREPLGAGVPFGEGVSLGRHALTILAMRPLVRLCADRCARTDSYDH